MARQKKVRRAVEAGMVVGKLTMTRHGYGFVRVPDGGDIFIGPRDVAGAMNGDTVGVRPDARRKGQGRSGRVVKVIERAVHTVVGSFEQHGGIGIVVPADKRMRHDVFVSQRDHGAKDGDIVVARITQYPSRHHSAQGIIDEVLGRPGDPGIEIEVIIREHGLETEFSEEALEQAKAERPGIDAALAEGREDIRSKFTFTIDPFDAKDFDDAISMEWVDGLVRMSVHIADVSHYVPWDSPLDVDARMRANSVYLVDRVLPMLPEELSNHICSLNPEEDKLAFTVEMDLSKDAHLEAYRLFPSVIRSDRRFNYDEVQAWLDGEAPFPDAESEKAIREFALIADAIGKRRIARGGLDFETVEPKVILDADANPIEVRVRHKTQATNMIEESAILANEVVARHMAEAPAPCIYRIHEDPDPEALEKIAVILKEFDYPIKDIHGASPATFQRIIHYAHNRPEKLLINSLLLRAMERARYTDFLAPHFGLASSAYTHFTSPIRRYPDLVVHRLLKAQLNGTLETDRDAAPMIPELGWIAEHASSMEREAEAAEDESVRFKLTQLMAEHVGEEFDGIITGVQNFGLFIQLENTAEGLVHVQSMSDDFYVLDAARHMLIGEDRGRVFRLGEALRVRVVSVSVADRRIDFEIA